MRHRPEIHTDFHQQIAQIRPVGSIKISCFMVCLIISTIRFLFPHRYAIPRSAGSFPVNSEEINGNIGHGIGDPDHGNAAAVGAAKLPGQKRNHLDSEGGRHGNEHTKCGAGRCGGACRRHAKFMQESFFFPDRLSDHQISSSSNCFQIRTADSNILHGGRFHNLGAMIMAARQS